MPCKSFHEVVLNVQLHCTALLCNANGYILLPEELFEVYQSVLGLHKFEEGPRCLAEKWRDVVTKQEVNGIDKIKIVFSHFIFRCSSCTEWPLS